MTKVELLSRRADELWTAGRHQEAAAVATQALALDPRHGPTLCALGSSLLQLGQTKEAVERLQACVEVAPDNAMLYNNLGLALAAEGRLDEAVRAYDRALVLNPLYARARSNRALARIRRYDYAAALEDADAALVIDPQYHAALVSQDVRTATTIARRVGSPRAGHCSLRLPPDLQDQSAGLRGLDANSGQGRGLPFVAPRRRPRTPGAPARGGRTAFATTKFTRTLERAYLTMYERQQRGVGRQPLVVT